MLKDEIIAQIQAAFADTPYPGDTFEAISATQRDEGIVEYFRGRTWREHRTIDLRHHSAALSFFTDSAYRYWLPAFMIAELQNPDEADIIAEHIAYHVAEKAEQFAQDELEAIASFLAECAQRYDRPEYDFTTFRQAERAIRARIRTA